MKECVILAGGLGSRLGDIAMNSPKCMLEIANRPFLSYLFDYLSSENFEHIILSLGYQADVVLKWLDSLSLSFDISTIIEEKPLGTGGAIKKALSKSKSNTPFVINGDTFFKINTTKLKALHLTRSSDITLALKPMHNFDRYGVVTIDDESKINKFYEKSFQEEGLINGGVYIINKNILLNLDAEIFSFEKDILEKKIEILSMFGYVEDAYFIDIGTPEDYEKANIDFSNFIK